MFLLPFLIVFTVFSWFPIARAIVMSFQETNLVSEPTWVGLDNFRRVLADPQLGIAVATPPGSRCSRSCSASPCRSSSR